MGLGGVSCRAALAFGLSAVPALAQELDLEAAFGNETGCIAERTGQTVDDDKFILRRNGFEQFESFCTFTSIAPNPAGGLLVRSKCVGEGLEWAHEMVVGRDPADPAGMILSFPETGQSRISRCD